MRFLRAAIIVAIVFASACARADERVIVSPTRTTYSLDGEWRCAVGKGREYPSGGAVDPRWKKVRLPGDLSKSGFASAASVWCMKKFTPPKGRAYQYLKIEGLTDAGEAWLNGTQLMIPGMPAGRGHVQPGVFGHIWPMEWEGYFDTPGAVVAGRENVVALRIVNDPAKSDKPYDVHPNPSARGAFGVSGSTYLVSAPEVRIISLDRTPPSGVSGGAARHQFFLLIGNSGIRERKLTASISIYDEAGGGGSVFSGTSDVDVTPAGTITDFTWVARPSFHTYRAVATLRGADSEIIDQVALRFAGAVCSVEKGRLTVNGEPFAVRGVHGDFGLVQGRRGEYREQWMRKDLDLAAAAGANAVHTAHPTPALAAEALKRGMMVIPSLGGDVAGVVLAMRESPNVLFWELSGPKDITAAVSVVSSLDPYHRPVALAGGRGDARVDKVSLYAAEQPGTACRGNGGAPARLVYYYPWARATGKGGPADAAAVASRMDIFSLCVQAGVSAGGVYASLAPGLRGAGSLDANVPVVDTLLAAFHELRPDFRQNEAGTQVLTLRSHADYPLYAIRVVAVSRGVRKLVASQAELDPGRNFNLAAPRDASSIEVAYTSHGGLTRGFDFSADTPAADPEAFSFETPEVTLARGKGREVYVVVRGGDEAAQAVVSIKAGGAVSVSPASRNVFLKRGQPVKVPFTLVAGGKKAGPVLVTALMEQKGGADRPLRAFMSATVR